MNPLTENISRLDRRIGGSPTLDAALGPLGDLVNGATWIGDAAGWNLMVVPSPKDPKNPFLVMVNKLFETHSFDAVPGPVPNRSAANGTARNGAVKYSQTVAELLSKNILHEETGMWLNQTLGTLPTDPSGFGLQAVAGDPYAADVTTNPVVRSGTIPHGNTVSASGISLEFPGLTPTTNMDVSPWLALQNFGVRDGGTLNFVPARQSGEPLPDGFMDTYMSQLEASLVRIGFPPGNSHKVTAQDLINPVPHLLNSAANNIVNVTALQVTTVGEDRGAVINVPFETTVAAPLSFTCTFMIETVVTPDFNPDPGQPNILQPTQDENPTFLQLQYLTSIPLLFPNFFGPGDGVIFPHFNLNTLVAI
jgi:hypothetical protein